MPTLKTEIKLIYLLHPVAETPSVGRRVGYYYDGLKVVGLKLQFPDGHTACLTYAQIGELMERHEDYDRAPDHKTAVSPTPSKSRETAARQKETPCPTKL